MLALLRNGSYCGKMYIDKCDGSIVSSVLSGCVDVETPVVCIGNEVDTIMVKKCTFEKCTIDVAPLPAQVKFVSSFGAIFLWILMLRGLFKNKIISYIFVFLDT